VGEGRDMAQKKDFTLPTNLFENGKDMPAILGAFIKKRRRRGVKPPSWSRAIQVGEKKRYSEEKVGRECGISPSELSGFFSSHLEEGARTGGAGGCHEDPAVIGEGH